MSYIIKHITKRDRINVCLVENHYVRGKGARQKRTHLGVLNNETNELLLSAKQPIIDGNLLKMLEEKERFLHSLKMRKKVKGQVKIKILSIKKIIGVSQEESI